MFFEHLLTNACQDRVLECSRPIVIRAIVAHINPCIFHGVVADFSNLNCKKMEWL